MSCLYEQGRSGASWKRPLIIRGFLRWPHPGAKALPDTDVPPGTAGCARDEGPGHAADGRHPVWARGSRYSRAFPAPLRAAALHAPPRAFARSFVPACLQESHNSHHHHLPPSEWEAPSPGAPNWLQVKCVALSSDMAASGFPPPHPLRLPKMTPSQAVGERLVSLWPIYSGSGWVHRWGPSMLEG